MKLWLLNWKINVILYQISFFSCILQAKRKRRLLWHTLYNIENCLMVTNKDSYINLSALPSELYLMWVQYPWPFGDLACDARIVITETIIYTSILTIVGFTCERWVHKNNISWISDTLCGRYWAICKPLSPFSRSSLSRAKRTIGIMWLFSFLTAFPWSFFTRYANEKI